MRVQILIIRFVGTDDSLAWGGNRDRLFLDGNDIGAAANHNLPVDDIENPVAVRRCGGVACSFKAQDCGLVAGLRQFIEVYTISRSPTGTRDSSTQPICAATGVTSRPIDILVAELEREIPSALVKNAQLESVQLVGIRPIIARIIPSDGNYAIYRIEVVPDKVASRGGPPRSRGNGSTSSVYVRKEGGNHWTATRRNLVGRILAQWPLKCNIAVIIDVKPVVRLTKKFHPARKNRSDIDKRRRTVIIRGQGILTKSFRPAQSIDQ